MPRKDHNRLFILLININDFSKIFPIAFAFSFVANGLHIVSCARLLFFALCLIVARVLVVSFKRPDKIATSATIKPFSEEPAKFCRKRKKPGESKYLHDFCFVLYYDMCYIIVVSSDYINLKNTLPVSLDD